jgi:hypothetical protein
VENRWRTSPGSRRCAYGRLSPTLRLRIAKGEAAPTAQVAAPRGNRTLTKQALAIAYPEHPHFIIAV